MRLPLALIAGLIAITVYTQSAIADENGQCKFDSFAMGAVIDIKDAGESYSFTLDCDLSSTWEYALKKSSPDAEALKIFMGANADKNSEPNPEGILFLSLNKPCGFTYGYADGVYIENYRLIDGKYIIQVRTAESTNEYTVAVSQNNSLYSDFIKIFSMLKEKDIDPIEGIHIVYDKDYELISIGEYGAMRNH